MVWPYIDMNQPWVYMCPPSWITLPPPSPSHPSGSCECTSPEHPVLSQLKTAAAAAKSFQSCPTLCNPTDGSPPGSTIPGILQARTLEWVAISFSNAWKWKVKVKSLSCVQLFATPWTAAYQAPPPMGFSRQEYWSGVPLPSPDNHLQWFCSQRRGNLSLLSPFPIYLTHSNGARCHDLSFFNI